MRFRYSRPGFIFLLSVLAIGAIAVATTISLLLLGGGAERSAGTLVDSSQAMELAQTCAERAIRSLRADLTYPGSETISLANGTCQVRPVGGAGNTQRTICTVGTVGAATHRLEIGIDTVYPKTLVSFWREVPSLTLCP